AGRELPPRDRVSFRRCRDRLDVDPDAGVRGYSTYERIQSVRDVEVESCHGWVQPRPAELTVREPQMFRLTAGVQCEKLADPRTPHLESAAVQVEDESPRARKLVY